MLFMIPLCFLKHYFFVLMIIYMIMFLVFFMKMTLFGYFSSICFFLGSDYITYFMILLSFWIIILMMMASKNASFHSYSGLFSMVILFLMIALYMTFCSMNVFIFYLFFEISLIPTLVLILGWGYQPERIQAGMYMFMYTLFGSLPMMISLFYFYNSFNSLQFVFIDYVNSSYIYICVIFVFLVKFPMYFVHLWLPKAHVEAPISGSMILAGVMLKLGGYGLMRFMKIFMNISLNINIVIMVIGLLGGSIISLLCLRQEDMKSLIAYSSVAHMGMALSGFMSLNFWGFLGGFIMMISHGLCSSGLFCVANISYERTHSRSMFLNKGLLNLMPSMSLWWFLLCSSNMAAPPSLNLVAEILLMNSLVSFCVLTTICIALISFFSGGYSLYLYSQTQHGDFNQGLFSFSLGEVREYLLLFLHWIPLNLIFMLSNLFLF
uniref:NADH dehydrogenase subunit 4 n=1 Tax=Photinus signaticollis TaxID=3018954 RepID=UPI0023AAE18B|nr:NADH dehydrogenase subunit 4 [Photinus signaticollis]WCD24463.1 NADH dehydrogenase subunit 4 [Photinus signaticollis]